ncbi:ribulose-phosphate 3-epimerase [Treponema parvum]|uniref:ribulose-phosphate 3-epimerase n=1 Tax=Treponema parvum TaxID=138851 RepID=UPI001AEBCBB5|nr:ribulose-phosphate 3-epimerase [Treponema parvum]QTQ16736.1 ribulose-phosphate 3-epimerase [Treponema parvum]
MKKPILAPSLLSADLSDLKGAFEQIEKNKAGAVHIDVMDGRFVPQITYGQPVIKSIRGLSKLPFDIHLMVEHPEDQIESFAEAGADWITFHYENNVHINRMIQSIRSLGKKAGIAIVPSTPVVLLSEILPEIDLVLVMTVNPGFGGQKFIEGCLSKIEQLKKIRQENGYSFDISVDGGINAKTLPPVIEAGADIIVSGSAFFSGGLKW